MDNKSNIVAVNTLIKNKEGNKVLIVKRCKDEIAYPGYWAFPGGKMEPGETIFEALRRESIEEVGLDIKQDYKKFIGDFNFTRKDNYNVIGLCFEVKALSEEVILDKDFDDYKWIYPIEIINFQTVPSLPEDIKIAFNK